MVTVSWALLLGACSEDSGPRANSGFESSEEVAGAFASEVIPDVEPWDARDGACRVLLIGDSLTEAVERTQGDAFSYVGCESIVDGLAARTLSTGWQCLGAGGRSPEIVLRTAPEPGNVTCRPSGLELLSSWSDFAHVASAVVIALGTNDAGVYPPDGWVRRWKRSADLSSGPLVFVTASARPGDPWADKVERYNATLRWWCPAEPRCFLAEWDQTAPAQDPTSYTDHVHLTRAAGEIRAVFIAAAVRQVAVPAPSGPRRWTAPEIDPSLSPGMSVAPSTSQVSGQPFPSQPPGPWPTQPTTTVVTVPSSVPTSVPTSPAVTTTTTIVDVESVPAP